MDLSIHTPAWQGSSVFPFTDGNCCIKKNSESCIIKEVLRRYKEDNIMAQKLRTSPQERGHPGATIQGRANVRILLSFSLQMSVQPLEFHE